MATLGCPLNPTLAWPLLLSIGPSCENSLNLVNGHSPLHHRAFEVVFGTDSCDLVPYNTDDTYDRNRTSHYGCNHRQVPHDSGKHKPFLQLVLFICIVFGQGLLIFLNDEYLITTGIIIDWHTEHTSSVWKSGRHTRPSLQGWLPHTPS